MTYERWEELIQKIKKQNPQAEIGREDLPDSPGYREYAEISLPAGKVRLELWVKPKVIERKTLYSHRMNTAATVQYKYDESEHTIAMHAYHWNDAQDDWQEVGFETLASSL